MLREEQANLDEYATAMADAARSAGERGALAAAGDWADTAWRAVVALARRGVEFTADDVAGDVGPAPSDGAAGAVFRAAASTGLIVAVGYRASRRPSRHGGVVRVWRGREGRQWPRGSDPATRTGGLT